jgi:hypothetical protein
MLTYTSRSVAGSLISSIPDKQGAKAAHIKAIYRLEKKKKQTVRSRMTT